MRIKPIVQTLKSNRCDWPIRTTNMSTCKGEAQQSSCISSGNTSSHRRMPSRRTGCLRRMRTGSCPRVWMIWESRRSSPWSHRTSIIPKLGKIVFIRRAIEYLAEGRAKVRVCHGCSRDEDFDPNTGVGHRWGMPSFWATKGRLFVGFRMAEFEQPPASIAAWQLKLPSQ